MTRRFSMQRGATRVVFGARSSEGLLREIEALGVKRVLVVCTAGRIRDAEKLATTLGSRSAGILSLAREHVPAPIVAEGRAEARRVEADAFLALGGGTPVGLAKALAVDDASSASRGVVIAVPTTYSGSEMTPVYGITEGGEKRTRRDERARPALVVYDPLLTLTVPREATLSSLWNAMAHAVEALWAREPDRATLLSAEEALRLLAHALPRLDARLDDLAARESALEGACLAGMVFADVGGGLHHKLCHVLGGSFGLPHAATHAALLPHVIRFHAAAAPEALAAIARALGVIDPLAALDRLARATAPRGLGALGMPRDGIDRTLDTMLALPSFFPRALDRDSLRALLESAFEGPSRGLGISSSKSGTLGASLRAPESIGEQGGFGGVHDSEALPGALPMRQNTPRPSPYGLYPQSHQRHALHRPESRQLAHLDVSNSTVVLTRPLRAPAGRALCGGARRRRGQSHAVAARTDSGGADRTDFLDGLVTLGGAGEPTSGPGYAVHLYAANADMIDRSFSNADGDVLVVPQSGTLECRTELGFLRAAPGTILLIPRGMKFAIGLPEGHGRGWMLEVFGPRLRLPERGPIGSNGLADARHFLAPTASFEDRLCPNGFDVVHKLGNRLHVASQEHSPFDVVAWHGNHLPFTYDLALFNAMGSVTFDHPDPSILTVLTAPLDDKGRAVVDFVVFPPRWVVSEHSFRPPFMHRNAATEINGVIRTPSGAGGYDAGCTFISPLLTAHGISTKSYDHVLDMPETEGEAPERLTDASLWMMFESAMPFRTTAWARETELVDREFLDEFAGMRVRFDPKKR